MESPLIVRKHPRLKNPYMVVGWIDAGLVGISIADYLIEKLGAEEFAEIEPPGFSFWPLTLVKGGVLQEIEYAANSFYYWKNKKGNNDLILFGGKPPELRQYIFANLMVDLAELFKVKRIYTVGGLMTDAGDTDNPKVFAVVNNSRLKKHVAQHGVELGQDYHGPAAMNSLLLGVAKHRGLEGVGLFGEVAKDIVEMPDLQVHEEILGALTEMLGLDIKTGEMDGLIGHLGQHHQERGHLSGKSQGIIPEISEEDKQIFFAEIEKFLKKDDKPGEKA